MHAAAAVEYMHSQNVVHRDLTSYNLLVTDKFEAKVCLHNSLCGHRSVGRGCMFVYVLLL